MVLTVLGIIYELIKGMVLLLPNLIKLVDAIVEYYTVKNKRLKDAVIAEEQAKKRATINNMERAKANIEAAQAIRDEGWKINYTQILAMVNENRRADLLVKMQNADWNTVNHIYDTEQPAEAKAFCFVEMLRNS